MKKKVRNILSVILVVVILLVLLGVIFTRRAMILARIDKKITEYENNYNNIYELTTTSNDGIETKLERFIKDGVDKIVIGRVEKDGAKTKIIQITYPNERKVYTEKNGVKVMNTYKENAAVRKSHVENDPTINASYTTIANYAYSMSLPQRIVDSMFTIITCQKVKGVRYFVLSSKYDSNLINDENTKKVKVFINKETYLPEKVVRYTNKDGNVYQNVTRYRYKFNCVTDKDMETPDESQYKMQQK